MFDDRRLVQKLHSGDFLSKIERMNNSNHTSFMDRRRRAELVFACTLTLLMVTVPIGWEKIFPFNQPSFFIAKVHTYCRYKVLDPLGKPLTAYEFGLGDFYWAQRGYFTEIPDQERGAVRLPTTINIFGQVQTQKAVTQAIRDGLERRPDLEYVTVVQEIKGPVDSKSVGVVETHEWRVMRAPEPSAE